MRARDCQERAIRHVEAALALDPDSDVFRNTLLQNLSILVQAQAQSGDAAAAAATARRVEDLAVTPRNHYNAACYLALAVKEAGPAPWASDLAARAVAQFRMALDGGYQNRALIARDRDLDSLRSRPDFQLLVMDLAMPADPFASGR